MKNRAKILKVNQMMMKRLKSLKSLRNRRKMMKRRKTLNQDLLAVTLDPDMKENQPLSINLKVPLRNLVLTHIAHHLDQAQEDMKLEDLMDHLAQNLLVR